jgi:hypothetical protein
MLFINTTTPWCFLVHGFAPPPTTTFARIRVPVADVHVSLVQIRVVNAFRHGVDSQQLQQATSNPNIQVSFQVFTLPWQRRSGSGSDWIRAQLGQIQGQKWSTKKYLKNIVADPDPVIFFTSGTGICFRIQDPTQILRA